MKNTNMKELEIKAYRSFFQDGVWEMMFGAILLITCLGLTLDDLGMDPVRSSMISTPLMLLVPPILLIGIKMYVTVPRMGLVKFGRARMDRLWKGKKYFVAGFIIGNLMLLGIYLTGFMRGDMFPLFMSIIISMYILMALLLVAYLLDYPGAVFIAAVVSLGEPGFFTVSHYTDFPYPSLVTHGLLGGILFVRGLSMLMRFLDKYPERAEAADA